MALSTSTLMGLQTTRKKFMPVFASLFFPKRMFFKSAKIDLDKVTRKNKRAPFVSPIVQGVPMRREGSSTLSVAPAYLKPLYPLEPTELQNRLPGESPEAPLTPEERRDAIFGNMAVEQDYEISIAEEWMCVQLVKFGKVVIESDFYPRSEIDFGRHPDNTIILAGAAKWDQLDKETYRLDKDLTNYMARARNPVTAYFMNQTTYAEFCEFKCIKDKLETRRGSESRLETAAFNGQLFVKMGDYGSVEVWVYTGTFDNDAGEDENFLLDGEIVMGGATAEGTMCYGMIHDPKANYDAFERFPKEFTKDDPAGEFLMTQSAPLPVPDHPDDFVYLKAF